MIERHFDRHDDVLALQALLTRTWALVDSSSDPALHPTPYSETFLDMARAVVDAGWQAPAAPSLHAGTAAAVGTRHLPMHEQMLVSAVRYASGRATYVVALTCEQVRAAWPRLTPQAQVVIAADATAAIAASTMRLDADEWRALVEWITSRATEGQ